MKITYLKVQNFKSLSNTEVESLADKNLFFGFNNSGKSNVFKFLDLLFKQKEMRPEIEVDSDELNEMFEAPTKKTGFWKGDIYDKPFLFNNDNRTNPIEFEVKLEIEKDFFADVWSQLEDVKLVDGDEAEIYLKGRIISKDVSISDFEISEAKINNETFYRVDNSQEKFFETVKEKSPGRKFGEKVLSQLNNIVLYLEPDRNFRKEFFNEYSNDPLNVENFKNWLFDLNINSDKNEEFNKLSEFLESFDFTEESKDALAFGTDLFPFGENIEIGFTKFDNEVEIMLRNKSGRFPLSSFGTGVQQFFFILVNVFWKKPKIVIIEELELNLSPLYQKEILRFLSEMIEKDFYDQLLFSSHSPFFTLKDHILVDSVHLVQMLDQGTDVQTYDDPSEFYIEEDNSSIFSVVYS